MTKALNRELANFSSRPHHMTIRMIASHRNCNVEYTLHNRGTAAFVSCCNSLHLVCGWYRRESR